MLDIAPVGAGIGLVAGAIFFVVLAGLAVIAFVMLKKTLKMAFRIAIVGIILVIAIAGAIAFFALGLGSGGGSGPRTPPNRTRPVQPN